jgi:hypothetical protein
MRCRNCSTVVADTDPVCPACHAFLGSRNTAAVAAVRRDGLLITWSRQSPVFKWGAGGLMLVGGVVAILIGAAIALQAKEDFERGAKTVTEAELSQVDDPDALQGTWIAYDSPKTIETGTKLEYISALKKQKIHSRFVLLSVGKSWMMAEVSPKFTGRHYVGEIRELSHSPLGEKVMADIRRRQPEETKDLLPYYLFAVKTFEQGTRGQYITAGGVGLFGLLFAGFALKMLMVSRSV